MSAQDSQLAVDQQACFKNQKVKHFIAEEQIKLIFHSDSVSCSNQKWEWIITIENHITGLLSTLQGKSVVHLMVLVFL